MSEIGSTSPPVPVRDRASRRRVNRITIDAYLLAAQKECERKARKTGGRLRDVSRLDRALITPSTVISTWIASTQGVLYLLRSGEATVQIRRRHQLVAVALRFVLPLLVPGLVLDALMFVAPSTYALLTVLLLVYGLAVLLAMAAVIACTLVRVLWMRQLRPKRA
ncbi:hypothetical protein ACF1AJ_19140, partial [Leifsonia sp. NPDC014704]|uniref:hypothetical protein n=1 Tax=Leifsonia sp. NPDC014704 TaxID=3364123 RepID=UPI0036F4A11A